MRILLLCCWSGLVFRSNALNQRTGGSTNGANQEILGFPSLEASHITKLKNFAAVLPSENAQLQVTQVSFPECGDEELIIKNYVVAINPVDWKIQSSISFFNLTYPTILGEDVAGEIVEVGSSLKKKFKVGQRVMSYTMGLGHGRAYGGFQLYPVLIGATTSVIPDEISFSEAAVLPLSISTAAAGLFMNVALGLDYPKAGRSRPPTNTKLPTLLVWGGSSSVGASTIQLAYAAGYNVFTTASPSNFEFCKNLGAADVVDYHNPYVVHELIKLLDGRNVMGAYDSIGSYETAHQIAAVLQALGGVKIATVGTAPEDLPSGVVITRISAGNIASQEPEVAKKIWGSYVPWALGSGALVPSPKALIVGKGLEAIQKGVDRQKAGVSARKVEVLLA